MDVEFKLLDSIKLYNFDCCLLLGAFYISNMFV